MEIAGIVVFLGLGVAGFLYNRRMISERQEDGRRRDEEFERKRQDIEKELEARRKEALLTAKEESLRILSDAELEIREKRAEIGRQERRLAQKEENLDRRADLLERREEILAVREVEADRLRGELNNLLQRQRSELERIANLSSEDARTQVLRIVEDETRMDAARLIRDIEEEARREGDRRARSIVLMAIQRCAVEQASETTVSVVPLPSDDLKGRIIGREGRNIRAFETLTGVDVVIDDTPEAVVVSSFDPVRREIARLALSNLVADGRIHPGRIEEMVEKAQNEVEEKMREAGERAVLETGVTGLHPELIGLLGRMRYRMSFGQNILTHSIEVALLCASIAAELGANAEIARRAGLLHDLGKVYYDSDQPHALISRDLMLRYGEPEEAALAAGAHHNDIEPETVEAVIVMIADAISASRPGARREMLENYVRRLQKLETIGDAFPGVEKTYAVQAGREIRLMVRPGEVDDLAAMELARAAAKRIEEEMASQYPSQIKVTVIRETRAVDYAK
ncbi:MAG: ribonuclease Y [Capsulimonadales bacterium]|nr:ribonuclease Y [Capsulimonadales bacterium]